MTVYTKLLTPPQQNKLASKANPNIVELRLTRVGKYPLYDIIITIADLGGLMKTFRQNTIQEARNYLTRISVGNIGAPQTGKLMGQQWISELQPIQLKLTSDDPQVYGITIAARNGEVKQKLHFRFVNGEWKTAVEVFFNDKKIEERADYHFPRNDKGQIQWVTLDERN